jgi:hypothetical protein
MAQTFKVSKERSNPQVRKHRSRLVVSAISKTPITVTPTPVADKKAHAQPEPQGLPAANVSANGAAPSPSAAPAQPSKRPRGRPRKGAQAAPPQAPARGRQGKAGKAGKMQRTRPHRIDHARLLGAERLAFSGKVPLAATRIVEQLESLLKRATVEAFRGKKDRPHVTLSKLEEQAIQEALTLFQLKVSLQRGGDARRLRVS